MLAVALKSRENPSNLVALLRALVVFQDSAIVLARSPETRENAASRAAPARLRPYSG